MEEALIKRVLPHSVEAEQSVIGAMLMDQEAIRASSCRWHTGRHKKTGYSRKISKE